MADKKVLFLDTTLRDGEQSAGIGMTGDEKMEIAKQLQRMRVDVIEAGFAASSPGDFLAVSNIAKEVKGPIIASLARAVDDDVDQAWGAVRALNALTGEKKWDFRLRTPPRSGVMATAGNLVFGSSNEGNVFALDSETGEALWSFQTGSRIAMNPMSFAVNGEQRVVLASGSAIFVFGLP